MQIIFDFIFLLVCAYLPVKYFLLLFNRGENLRPQNNYLKAYIFDKTRIARCLCQLALIASLRAF